MKRHITLLSIFFFLLSFTFMTHEKASAQVVINEYSCSNYDTFVDQFQEYNDWFELYNASSSSTNIGGCYLSDDPTSVTKWKIPTGTTIPAHGFIRFWASGRDNTSLGEYHTNFKLTQTKTPPESIVFSDANGNIIDQQLLSVTQKEHSNGRKPDGSSVWGVFTTPTPGASNSSTQYQRYALKPVMSVAGGFYTSTQTVSISTNEVNCKIRYTINGTEPTATSALYTTPITVTSTKVIKARVFSNDAAILPSLIDFNTYFINENFTLPVVW